MTRKKILKNGTSYCVVIPVSYLELLGISKENYKEHYIGVSADYKNRQVIISNADYQKAPDGTMTTSQLKDLGLM